MRLIKNYTDEELLELTKEYNTVVKDRHRIEEFNLDIMRGIVAIANEERGLEFPYYEISSHETKSGTEYILEFDWVEEVGK
jgi:hypothetical protein